MSSKLRRTLPGSRAQGEHFRIAPSLRLEAVCAGVELSLGFGEVASPLVEMEDAEYSSSSSWRPARRFAMKCSVAVCAGREGFCHCRRLLFKQNPVIFSPSCAGCLVCSVPSARCKRLSQGFWPAEHGLGCTCIQLRRGSNQGASTHASLLAARCPHHLRL